MPTIRKLAEVAGVSIGTVSMALRDDARVHPDTRKRIQELATLYNYRPNRLTQSLISGRSATIGCLVPEVANDFCSRVLCGVLQQANAQAYQVMTLETHASLSHTLLALEALTEQRVAGVLVMAGIDQPLPLSSVLMLRSHRVHPVLIDVTKAAVAIDTVRSDETQMAELVVEYLVRLRHRVVGFVGAKGPRQHAIMKALRRHGLSDSGVMTYEGESYTHLTDDEAEALFQRMMALEPRPTAFIIQNDVIAAHLIRCAQRHGIRIPETMSLLGYSNTQWCGFLTPGLTSIEQHAETIGTQACELLLRRIREGTDDEGAIDPVNVTVPAELRLRESCGPAPNR